MVLFGTLLARFVKRGRAGCAWLHVRAVGHLLGSSQVACECFDTPRTFGGVSDRSEGRHTFIHTCGDIVYRIACNMIIISRFLSRGALRVLENTWAYYQHTAI